MPVDSKHPDYIDHIDEWSLMRQAKRGRRAINAEGTKYLPMPSGFQTLPDQGQEMYLAYMKRARFPDILRPTLRGMVGLIHRTEAQIEMPTVMEPIWERATQDGIPLETFHRRITSEIMLTGRYGILTDASEAGSIPFLAGYSAEAVINWAEDRSFFVLDESGPVREGFDWRDKQKFRVLELKSNVYSQQVHDQAGSDAGTNITPTRRGSTAGLDVIPFVVAGPTSLAVAPDEIPLEGIAQAAMTIYQLSADYRLQLFMTGQETLFTVGLEEPPTMVGAAVRIALPLGGDAKYVGPQGKGIEAHEKAIKNAEQEAVAAGVQLFDRQSGQESGEALRVRYAAQTATLTTVALQSAAALEQSLRYIAIFLGQDPTKVIVKPNLKFVDTSMTAADAEALMRLWMGNAISKLTLHENLVRGEIASPERSFEEEEELIEAEPIDEPIVDDNAGGEETPPPEEEEEDQEESAAA